VHAYGEKILSPCVWLLATSLILVSPKIPVAVTPCSRELPLSSTSSRLINTSTLFTRPTPLPFSSRLAHTLQRGNRIVWFISTVTSEAGQAEYSLGIIRCILYTCCVWVIGEYGCHGRLGSGLDNTNFADLTSKGETSMPQHPDWGDSSKKSDMCIKPCTKISFGGADLPSGRASICFRNCSTPPDGCGDWLGAYCAGF
jgi:hypothetical protein